MTSQFVGSAYLALSIFVILILAQTSQKPLCINSQVIEKITMTDQTSIYRCAVRKKVFYSANFIQNQKFLEEKILPFEQWISRIWNVKVPRLAITLVNHPIVTQLKGKNISIWEQNLKATQQLEFEIAKNYLSALNPVFFGANNLALNSLADFTVRIWSENQVLSYGGFSTYMAHQWWIAFSELKAQEKLDLLKRLPQIVKQASSQVFDDSETRTYDQLVQLTQLFSHETRFFSLLKSRNTFEENSLTASFDYLVLMPEIRSGIFQSLYSIQKQKPALNLGIWDGKTLFHIGSRSQISADSFNKLKVRKLIWESCDDLELKDVLGVSAEVQKLLVVRNCSQQNQPDYNQYVKKGISGFAATHPQISFVQLDMPSLNMRRDDMVLQQKIFALMTQQALSKEGKNSFLSLFGLERLNWNHELQIYLPKSQIDAVESFRVIKTN